jgi:hypothetical protein
VDILAPIIAMGGSSSSPKTVTVEQDDGSTVVSVSEAVARRLLGKPDAPAVDTSRVAEDKLKKDVSSFPVPSGREDKMNMLEAYQDRIQVLERHTSGLEQLSREKFEETVAEVEAKFMKPAATAPVCVELQNAVLRCYQENQTSTLNCAPQVRAFKECVEQQRQALVARKG